MWNLLEKCQGITIQARHLDVLGHRELYISTVCLHCLVRFSFPGSLLDICPIFYLETLLQSCPLHCGVGFGCSNFRRIQLRLVKKFWHARYHNLQARENSLFPFLSLKTNTKKRNLIVKSTKGHLTTKVFILCNDYY